MEAWDLIVVDEEESKEGLPTIFSPSLLVDEKPEKPLVAVSAPSQVCLHICAKKSHVSGGNHNAGGVYSLQLCSGRSDRTGVSYY